MPKSAEPFYKTSEELNTWDVKNGYSNRKIKLERLVAL